MLSLPLQCRSDRLAIFPGRRAPGEHRIPERRYTSQVKRSRYELRFERYSRQHLDPSVLVSEAPLEIFRFPHDRLKFVVCGFALLYPSTIDSPPSDPSQYQIEKPKHLAHIVGPFP